jgi:hypothetical protein
LIVEFVKDGCPELSDDVDRVFRYVVRCEKRSSQDLFHAGQVEVLRQLLRALRGVVVETTNVDLNGTDIVSTLLEQTR